MLSLFPRVLLDEIRDLIESVSEGFPTYSLTDFNLSSLQLVLCRGGCRTSSVTIYNINYILVSLFKIRAYVLRNQKKMIGKTYSRSLLFIHLNPFLTLIGP